MHGTGHRERNIFDAVDAQHVATGGGADKAAVQGGQDPCDLVVRGQQQVRGSEFAEHGQGRLASQTVVGTVMSNFGLELAMKKAGIQLMRTPVGDRYLMERMLADGYNFGGEQSGHFIFLDHNTTGDGLISALQILSLMKRTGKPLSELAKAMTAVPQILLNVKVKHKPDLNQIPDIQQAIKTAESTLNGSGRVLVRYSGTEALLRIMVEGERDSTIREVADHLADIVRARIG